MIWFCHSKGWKYSEKEKNNYFTEPQRKSTGGAPHEMTFFQIRRMNSYALRGKKSAVRRSWQPRFVYLSSRLRARFQQGLWSHPLCSEPWRRSTASTHSHTSSADSISPGARPFSLSGNAIPWEPQLGRPPTTQDSLSSGIGKLSIMPDKQEPAICRLTEMLLSPRQPHCISPSP